MVQGLGLGTFTAEVWVQPPLVGELRTCKPSGTAKKKKNISPVQVLAQAIPWRFHFSSTFCRWQITLEQPDSRGGQLEAVRVPCTMPVCWVVSDSLWPRGLQTTWLLCPWDFPGKNTGVGGHALLQGIFLPQGLNPHLYCFPPLTGGIFTNSTTWGAWGAL